MTTETERCKYEITDEQIEELMGIANGLRGMSMDPGIHADGREFLMKKAEAMDAIIDPLLED